MTAVEYHQRIERYLDKMRDLLRLAAEAEAIHDHQAATAFGIQAANKLAIAVSMQGNNVARIK